MNDAMGGYWRLLGRPNECQTWEYVLHGDVRMRVSPEFLASNKARLRGCDSWFVLVECKDDDAVTFRKISRLGLLEEMAGRKMTLEEAYNLFDELFSRLAQEAEERSDGG